MNRVGCGFVVAALFGLGVGSASRAGAAPITPSPFDEAHVSVGAGYVPIVGDFDGDGHSDVFWYHPGPGADYIWWGTGNASTFGTVHDEFVVNGNYRPVAGDFNGDGRTDIAWFPASPPSTTLTIWLGRANRTFSSTGVDWDTTSQNIDYREFVGDFNGDGADDIFSWAPNRTPSIVFGESGNPILVPGGSAPLVRGDYTAIPADYNGDGRTDIYWAARNGGSSYLWATGPFLPHTEEPKFTSWPYQSVAPPTSFAGDFNGDGNADLFVYGHGAFAERILPGSHTNVSPITFATTVVPNVVGTYTPVVGKFASNAKSDIIWYTGTGAPSPFWIAR